MNTTAFRAIIALLALALSAPAALAAGGEERMSDRALAAIENNPNDWVDLIVTYRQRPDAAR